ncbi:MAG: DUF6629 family protein [Prochlorococcaceae cyanobacterium]
MCFSSTASFTAAACLLPLGLTASRITLKRQRPQLLPVALIPVFFAVQQALEGLVWLGLERPEGSGGAFSQASALAYLFFALAFWLAWLPWCALRSWGASSGGWRRSWIRVLLILGLVLGVLLWLPLLLDPSRLDPTVVHGSIDYRTQLLAEDLIGHGLGSLIYATTITVPLLLTPYRRLRWFVALLLLSFSAAQVLYLYAFSSVWCYFAAVLSAQVLWIVLEEPLTPCRRNNGASAPVSAADAAPPAMLRCHPLP